MKMWVLLPEVIQEKVLGYFIDLCFVDHKRVFNSCLKQVVFSNEDRMKEIKKQFMYAAIAGDHKTLHKHLQFGHSFYSYFQSFSPLHYAVSENNYNCVEILTRYDEDNKYDNVNRDDGPVRLAICSENLDILRLLLKRGYYPHGTMRNPTLRYIDEYEKYDILQVFLDCNVYFSAYFLLHFQCFNVIRYMMDRGYDPTMGLWDKGIGFKGTRKNFYKLIYVTCIDLDFRNCDVLSRVINHVGGIPLEYNEQNPYLIKHIGKIKERNEARYDFMWFQE